MDHPGERCSGRLLENGGYPIPGARRLEGAQAHWILVPTWVVDCDWFPDAKDDFWKEEFEDEANPYSRSGAHLLYLNAQTGKLLDPMDTSRKRSDAPKILTWK